MSESLAVLLNMVGTDTKELRRVAQELWNRVPKEKLPEAAKAIADPIRKKALSKKWLYDKRGRPVLGTLEQAHALVYCLEEGSFEDALGHVLQLLHELRRTKGYKHMKLKELNAHWGVGGK